MRRLACDGGIVCLVEDADGTPLDVGRRTRSIPTAMLRALESRDRGCRFPGCTHRHFMEGHHIEHWAHGGETRLDNLVQLCDRHHRAVHEGGFGVRYLEGSRFEFTRPDGTVIEHCPTLDSAESSQHADIESFNRTNDLDIDAGTCTSLWDGTQMDMNMALCKLLADDSGGGGKREVNRPGYSGDPLVRVNPPWPTQ